VIILYFRIVKRAFLVLRQKITGNVFLQKLAKQINVFLSRIISSERTPTSIRNVAKLAQDFIWVFFSYTNENISSTLSDCPDQSRNHPGEEDKVIEGLQAYGEEIGHQDGNENENKQFHEITNANENGPKQFQEYDDQDDETNSDSQEVFESLEDKSVAEDREEDANDVLQQGSDHHQQLKETNLDVSHNQKYASDNQNPVDSQDAIQDEQLAALAIPCKQN